MTEPRAMLDAYAEEYHATRGRLEVHAPRTFAALRAVLDLHRPGAGEDGPVCWKCRGRGDDWPDDYPCETVRAITNALT